MELNYTHKETRANSDATCNYDIIGSFPVKFINFFKWVLKNDDSFRIEFGATNKCYGGWLGNRIEMHKNREDDAWHFVKQEPENWFDELANRNVIDCWANGGWGQMTYFCTFEED